MTEAANVYVGLGANLGDPERQIERALVDLDALPSTRLLARSSLYRSRPVGYLRQPDFINAVAHLKTTLPPRALLTALLDVERRHGRQRSFRNAPRTIDLDILLYDHLRISEPGLHLPHPRLHERPFVLVPLEQIAPRIELPGHGPLHEILGRLGRDTVMRLPESDRSVA